MEKQWSVAAHACCGCVTVSPETETFHPAGKLFKPEGKELNVASGSPWNRFEWEPFLSDSYTWRLGASLVSSFGEVMEPSRRWGLTGRRTSLGWAMTVYIRVPLPPDLSTSCSYHRAFPIIVDTWLSGTIGQNNSSLNCFWSWYFITETNKQKVTNTLTLWSLVMASQERST